MPPITSITAHHIVFLWQSTIQYYTFIRLITGEGRGNASETCGDSFWEGYHSALTKTLKHDIASCSSRSVHIEDSYPNVFPLHRQLKIAHNPGLPFVAVQKA